MAKRLGNTFAKIKLPITGFGSAREKAAYAAWVF